MSRLLVAALIVLFVPGALAKDTAKEPKDETAVHAAKACTMRGAFGRWFGEAQYGHIDTTAKDEWAPFRKLTISDSQIRAVADFRGKGETWEGDYERAHKFLTALDKAIKDKGRFKHRKAYGGGVSFRTSEEPDTGLVFDIRQQADHIIADCVALGRPDAEDTEPE